MVEKKINSKTHRLLILELVLDLYLRLTVGGKLLWTSENKIG